MDTDRLRYFVTVAKLGSLARAAEVLRISPPALSKAMATLEREIGRKLFVRSGRGLLLTDDGQAATSEAEAIVARLEVFANARAVPSAALRLVSFEVFTTHLLGPLAREIPGELELHEAIPGGIERAIAAREADVGLTYLPIPTPGVEFLRIAPISMAVFARTGSFRGVALADLPFVVPISPLGSTPTRVRGLDGWPDDRLARRTAYRVALMESAMELCRQGLAVAFLPRFVVRLHNGKHEAKWRLAEIAEAPTGSDRAHVWLVQRRASGEDLATKKLARILRLLCRD